MYISGGYTTMLKNDCCCTLTLCVENHPFAATRKSTVKQVLVGVCTSIVIMKLQGDRCLGCPLANHGENGPGRITTVYGEKVLVALCTTMVSRYSMNKASFVHDEFQY